MLDLDCGQEFDSLCDADFFAMLPSRPGVFLLEMRDPAAFPYLARTVDIRRAAERLLRAPDAPSKRLNLRDVAARIKYRITGSKFEQTLALYDHARAHFPLRYRDFVRLRPPALLKVNLRNEYPRLYVTRRIGSGSGFYLGPFASRRSAEAFSEGFLDLFKIRRCQIKIRRDPSFPGCIYSEMKMCLAPCFAGCTKEEYDAEVARVLETLESRGTALADRLEREREAASEGLDFERAAMLHKRVEKAAGQMRGIPELARQVDKLDAVILQRAAEEMTIIVFPMHGGVLARPIFLRFAELSSQPRSVEAILRNDLEPHTPTEQAVEGAEKGKHRLGSGSPDLADHLSLVARWFYSKPRDGEIFFRQNDWPYRRILRACGRLLAPPGSQQAEVPPSK